jgi:thioredoxin family protein
MFTSIGAGNFSAEVVDEKRPVLLAYIVPAYAYAGQLEVLEILSKRYFDDLIKICLLSENSVKNMALRNIIIDGSPTFIIFNKGEEKARMIGKTDAENLLSFVLKTLAEFQHAE